MSFPSLTFIRCRDADGSRCVIRERKIGYREDPLPGAPVGQGNGAQSVPKKVCQGGSQNCIEMFGWFKMIEGDFELQATFFMISSNSVIGTKLLNKPPVQGSFLAQFMGINDHPAITSFGRMNYWQLCSFGQICHDCFSGRVFPLHFFHSLMVHPSRDAHEKSKSFRTLYRPRTAMSKAPCPWVHKMTQSPSERRLAPVTYACDAAAQYWCGSFCFHIGGGPMCFCVDLGHWQRILNQLYRGPRNCPNKAGRFAVWIHSDKRELRTLYSKWCVLIGQTLS